MELSSKFSSLKASKALHFMLCSLLVGRRSIPVSSCGHVKVVKVPLAGRSRMWLPKVHPSKAWRGQPLGDPHICTICPGMPGDAMVWPPGYRSRQGDLTPRPWQGRRQSCPVPLTTSSTFTISYTRFTATNGHSAQREAHRRQMLTAAPANLNTTLEQRGLLEEVEDQASRT